MFLDYKFWLKQKIESGDIKAFNKNINLHIDGSIEAINGSVDQQHERVRNQLTRILDQIAVEFSGADKAIVEAIKRDINSKSKQDIIRDFERNLATLQPTHPHDPDLRESDADHQKKITEFNKNNTIYQQIKPTL